MVKMANFVLLFFFFTITFKKKKVIYANWSVNIGIRSCGASLPGRIPLQSLKQTEFKP